MKITGKDQVTIPMYIREQFDLEVDNGRIFLIRKESPVKKLKGFAKGKFTTEEIMKLTREED